MGLFTDIRHLRVNPNAAFVVDDLVTEPTWTPRGVTIKGPVRIRRRGLGTRLRSALDRTDSPLGVVVGIDADPFAAPTPPRKLADADR